MQCEELLGGGLLDGVEVVMGALPDEGKKVTPAMSEGWKGAMPTTLPDAELPRCVERLCLTKFAFVLNFFPQFLDGQVKKLVVPCRAT